MVLLVIHGKLIFSTLSEGATLFHPPLIAAHNCLLPRIPSQLLKT